MPADLYLHFTVLFVSYFVKVAVACLLCWLLARLLPSPRHRFAAWLAFMLASAGYWFYSIMSSFSAAPPSAAAGPTTTVSPFPRIAHQFLVPARFGHATVVLGRVLICAYIAGVLIFLLDGIWKRMRLRILLRQGAAPSPALQGLFTEMCRHFGVKRCELMVLPKAGSPATVYWWRPRIVLPHLCERVGDDALMADILYHELAHVVRHDYFWSSIMDLICRLLFFHPGVWQARGQMRLQREMACDLAVVAARPEHRADYAGTLTRVARLCLPRKSPLMGIDFSGTPSLLAHRVRAILTGPEKSSWITNLSRTTAGLGLIGSYGFFCSAIAFAVAFAPSPQWQPRAEQLTTTRAPDRTASRHKARRETIAQPQAEGFITDSPAYRLSSSNASFAGASGLAATSEQHLDPETAEYQPPSPAGRAGPIIKPANTTLGSIIVATVGTVASADKDDRKRKEGAGPHFTDLSSVPSSY